MPHPKTKPNPCKIVTDIATAGPATIICRETPVKSCLNKHFCMYTHQNVRGQRAGRVGRQRTTDDVWPMMDPQMSATSHTERTGVIVCDILDTVGKNLLIASPTPTGAMTT